MGRHALASEFLCDLEAEPETAYREFFNIRVKSFDVMDRVTNIAWKTASSNVLRSFAYRYNTASMITNIALEDGTSLSYSYDDLDRLISRASFDLLSISLRSST
jgi:YD repeat-containing protein